MDEHAPALPVVFLQVEVHMMHMLVQGMMHTLLKAAEAGARTST